MCRFLQKLLLLLSAIMEYIKFEVVI